MDDLKIDDIQGIPIPIQKQSLFLGKISTEATEEFGLAVESGENGSFPRQFEHALPDETFE